MPRKKQTSKSRKIATTRSSLTKAPSKDLTINVKVVECPTVNRETGVYDFDFKFVGKCPVRSCQFHTDVTSSNCLILDTKLPSNNFTDPQLFYFKIQKNPEIPRDQKPKPRTVNLMRKKATTAVRANVIFYYYMGYIRDKYCPEDTEFIYRPGFNKNLDTVLGEFPFTQEGVTIFEHWMLPLLFDKEVYQRFLKDEQNMQMASSDINLQSVLGLTPAKFIKTQMTISELNNADFQQKIAGSLF